MRNPTLRFASLLLVGALLVSGPGWAAPPGSPDQSLTMVSSVGAEPDVEVSPANANRLVLSAITDPRPITASFGPYPAWSSSNGGRTWSQSNGAGPLYYGDPTIDFDASGNSYLCLDTVYPPYVVYVNKSTDGGATYPSLVTVMDQNSTFTYADEAFGRPFGGSLGTFYDFPKVGVDRSANPARVFVTAMAVDGIDKFADGTCDGTAFVLMSSSDGGMTWGNGRVYTDTQSPFRRIAIASDGTIHLASTSGGGLPCPGVDHGVLYRRSSDHGLSFTNPSCVWNSGPDDVRAAEATVDPTNPNHVWISFNQTVATPTPCQHVYVMRSLDGGSNWSAAVRVDDVLPNDVADRIGPSLSVSSTGRLDIAWFDYRNGPIKINPPNNSPGDVYYSYSTDGGSTWATSLRVSSTTGPALRGAYNDFLTVTSSGKKAHVAFGQDAASDGQIEAYVNTLTHK